MEFLLYSTRRDPILTHVQLVSVAYLLAQYAKAADDHRSVTEILKKN